MSDNRYINLVLFDLDGTLVVSGADILARVTGEAAHTIEWRATIEAMEHG